MTVKWSRENKSSYPSATGQSRVHSSDKITKDLVQRTPPQNVEAEQAVLGGVFLRNSIFHTLVDMLSEDDFYSPAHRTIYQIFVDLYRNNIPIDPLTTAEHLEKKNKLEEVGGGVYLASLTESVASAANAVHYARIIQDKSLRRQLIQVAAEIISESFADEGDVGELVDQAEKDIFAISEAKTTPTFKSSKDLVTQVFEQLEQRVERKELVTGVPTGYHKFDEITAGLQRTDLIIVAGRPSMGKTAFALNLCMRSAILYGVPTAIFSLEMSMEQLMMRMLCSWGKVDLSRMRSGFLNDEDWTRLYQAAGDLSTAPIYIDDTPSLTTMEMRARCRRLKAEKNLGFVVVDYLQLMRASRKIDSREQEISDISRNLKALAKEIDVPVIALSQLNRKVEDRTDKRPMLADLRESGAIEQDADVIVFLYRDDAYNKREDNPKKGIAEIVIGKQRNGPVGTVQLSYIDKFTSFENLSDMPEPSEG